MRNRLSRGEMRGWAAGGSRVTIGELGATSVSVGIRCRENPANACVNGGTLHKAVAIMYGATMTLSDSSAPSVSNVTGPLLIGGYLRGNQSVTFDASDNVGIRSARLYVDGAAQPSETYGCDFTYAVPCSNKSGAQLSLDTKSLADGLHHLQVAVVDPAGNEIRSSSHAIVVDNGAPGVPQDVVVDGGDGWRPSNSFSISWRNPTEPGLPVRAVHYELCRLDGSTCQVEQQTAGPGIARLENLAVPSTGEWSLRLWLEGAAGNVGDSRVATTTLRYGLPPAAPQASADATVSPPFPPAAPTTTSFVAPLPGVSVQPTIIRRDPRLRLTSARLTHGRLVIRGRAAPSLTAGLRITARATHHRPLTRSVLVRGGRFTLSTRRGLSGTVTFRVRGNASFRAAAATLRTAS